MQCAKCSGEMEDGLIADKMGDLGTHLHPKWANKITGFNLLGYGLENPKEVKTYRCKNCGFLESYAR